MRSSITAQYAEWADDRPEPRAALYAAGGSLAMSAGISAPLIGWLLDKIEARIVMVGGAALAGAAYLLASQVHSFTTMLSAYLLLGVGICAAPLLPAALVVSFRHGRRPMSVAPDRSFIIAADRRDAVRGWRSGQHHRTIKTRLATARARPAQLQTMS